MQHSLNSSQRKPSAFLVGSLALCEIPINWPKRLWGVFETVVKMQLCCAWMSYVRSRATAEAAVTQGVSKKLWKKKQNKKKTVVLDPRQSVPPTCASSVVVVVSRLDFPIWEAWRRGPWWASNPIVWGSQATRALCPLPHLHLKVLLTAA